MKLKELIEVLSNYDEELEVVFYGLEYFALEEKELESIQGSRWPIGNNY
jgi:hypothetical protein